MTTSAATLNFDGQQTPHMEQGARFYRTFNWMDGAKQPIPLDTYTGKLQVKVNVGGDLIIELSTENGRITMNEEGLITMEVSSDDTEVLTPGEYVYDFKITDETGQSYRILEGTFVIKAQVTI